MEQEDFTIKEAEWIKSFKKIVKSMPKTLEVSVTYGSASIYNAGATDLSLATVGNKDNVQHFATKCTTIIGCGLLPCSESL